MYQIVRDMADGHHFATQHPRGNVQLGGQLDCRPAISGTTRNIFLRDEEIHAVQTNCLWVQLGHLVLDGDLIGSEVAGVLVIMVQEGHSGAGAVVQELHAQHLQLVYTDVEGLLKPHGIHGNHLHTWNGTHVCLIPTRHKCLEHHDTFLGVRRKLQTEGQQQVVAVSCTVRCKYRRPWRDAYLCFVFAKY